MNGYYNKCEDEHGELHWEWVYIQNAHLKWGVYPELFKILLEVCLTTAVMWKIVVGELIT